MWQVLPNGEGGVMNLENLRAEDVARIFLRLALIVLGVYLVVRAILVLLGLGGDAVT